MKGNKKKVVRIVTTGFQRLNRFVTCASLNNGPPETERMAYDYYCIARGMCK
jgi:hypothetical protein